MAREEADRLAREAADRARREQEELDRIAKLKDEEARNKALAELGE